MQPLSDRYDLWCDLTQEYYGLAQSLTRFAKNPSGIRAGERIRIGDHPGRRAMAEVVSVDHDGVVYLKVDNSTFHIIS